MSLLDRVNEEYSKRDCFTCDQCHKVNIIATKSVSRRKKRAHMVYCDDSTWYGLRAASASLGMNMGAFLAFLNGLWQRERSNISAIAEDDTGANPRGIE